VSPTIDNQKDNNNQPLSAELRDTNSRELQSITSEELRETP